MSVILVARRALLRGAASLAIVSATLAVPLTLPLATAAQAASAAVAPIQKLDQALLTVMKQGKATPFATRASAVAPAIDSALDLSAILRLSVGPGWSKLTPAQQARLFEVFRQYTIATFVENFDSYDGQNITIAPQTRSLSDGAQVVSTRIIPRAGGEGHKINYVMRQTPGGWKATDVLVDGTISRVAVMRSDFAAMLASGGAPALEASLQKKTASLQAG